MEKESNKKEIVISQGAEAKIYKTHFLGGPCIVKERFEKKYRNPILDAKLSKERIFSEVRNMTKLRKKGINTPYVMFIDLNTRKIYMQYIDHAVKLRDLIYHQANREHIISKIMTEVGKILALMHDSGCIHGDLTTSNILVRARESISLYTPPVDDKDKKDNVKELFPEHETEFASIYLIDFGLSYVSGNVEDRAVDLYVLEKAFLSTHPNTEKEFDLILQSYQKTSEKGEETMKRLEKVRMRGRKRLAFG